MIAIVAYACRITESNMGAIASENPHFDLEEAMEWLKIHGSGYFLRDEESIFDCKYFEDFVFFQMYTFESSDNSDLFRRVLKL